VHRHALGDVTALGAPLENRHVHACQAQLGGEKQPDRAGPHDQHVTRCHVRR
jgi:hypothetical protein